MVTVRINERTQTGKNLLGVIKELLNANSKGIELVPSNTAQRSKPNAQTQKAIEDVENGKTYKAKSVKAIFNKARS